MQRINLDFFEQVLIYKSLTDEKYLSTIVGAVNPQHFKDKNIKNIFSIIKKFYDKHNIPPTVTELKTYLIDAETKESFKAVVSKFSELDKTFNTDELLENTERYIKERAIWQTMLDISKDVTTGNIDTGYILDKFEKSCNIHLRTNVGLDLFRDLNVLIDDLSIDQPVISTGYNFLDKNIGGGWLKNGRAIYIFAGETNVGKSIFLGNFANNIANQGKTVLLITLEMSELVYGKRLISGISKIPIADLRTETQTLKTQILEHCKEFPTSKIIIKEFPPSTITPSQLQGYIKNVQSTGIHIDAIVLDYVNLLKGSVGDNTYERVKIVTEQVRALSYIFNCPIISATQLNRCVAVSTVVNTINGDKEIKDLQLGERIRGKNGYVTVKHIYPIEKQRCYKIKTKSGKEIVCSANHLFPTTNGVSCINSGLKIGDSLLTATI